MSVNTGKLVTKITLDETLISDVPFLRCLEFLYTGIVELEAKSTLMDETMKVAELFNLPELQTICENAKKGDEFIPFNPSIGTWLNDRNSGIAKQLFLNQPLLSDVRLMVEGKTIHAHKVVFLARCDVLSAMFRGGFVEGEGSEVRGCEREGEEGRGRWEGARGRERVGEGGEGGRGWEREGEGGRGRERRRWERVGEGGRG